MFRVARRALSTLSKPVPRATTGEHVSVAASQGLHRLSVVEVKEGVQGVVTNLRSQPYADATVDVWVASSAPSSAPAIEVNLSTTVRSVEIPVGTGLLGRVVNGLGFPIDGKGVIEGPKARLTTALPVPGPVARSPVSALWPTGYTAIDTFYGVKRGQFNLLLGEAGLGKSEVALTCLLTSLLSSPDAVAVLAFVGRSRKHVASNLARIASAGLAHRVTVVAAAEEDTVAAQYLAPFTAATIGAVYRDAGKHCILMFDRLSSHFEAARQISGDVGDAEFTAKHGTLVEVCAQLSSERGGGSLSALTVYDITTSGLTSPDRRRDAAGFNLASLADSSIRLSARESRRGALLPIDLEDIGARTGHAVQGPATCYYVNAAKLLLAELRESVSNATAALEYGIEHEADQDAALDWFAKFNLLIFPTKSAVAAATGARTLADSARLALGLYSGVVDSGVVDTTTDSPSSPTSEVSTQTSSAPLTPQAASVASGPPQSPVKSERDAKLEAKMTPEQLMTLQAIRSAKGAKSSIASKYVTGGKKSGVEGHPQTAPSGSFVATQRSQPEMLLSLSADAGARSPSAIASSAQGPHRVRSAETLFLNLFTLVHGYVKKVPLSSVLQYQNELEQVLRAMPSPQGGQSLLTSALTSVPVDGLFGLPAPSAGTRRESHQSAADEAVWRALHAVTTAFTSDFTEKKGRL